MHKVVFEIAMDGAENGRGLAQRGERPEIARAKSTTIEVVAHGKGVGLLLAHNGGCTSELKTNVEKLHGSGVLFAVCENTRRECRLPRSARPTRNHSGFRVSAVIRKQEAGYAYIKTGADSRFQSSASP